MKYHQSSNKQLLFILFFFISITKTFGYLGPGMAGGFIITILSIAGTILIFFWGLLYYPIKNFFQKLKKKIFDK